MHYVVCQSKWWNIHYPKLEGEKTESCNKIILSHIKKLMGEIDLKQEVAITLNYDVKTRIKEQIFEQEDQFYLEDGDINVRLAIPAGSYYYQYVKVEKAHYKN